MNNLLIKFAATVDTVGSDKNLKGNVTTILNGVIAALGLVAVVVIIIGGVNYMTSAGDTSKIEKAKKTILYGLIGMIICALAFAIVNFVISNIINTPQKTASSITTKKECEANGYTWKDEKKCVAN